MTPTATQLSRLRRLARLYEVSASYVDQHQQTVQADAEGLMAVLRALGADVDSFDDLAAAMETRLRELWDWRLEPVHVAWEGALDAVLLHVPAGAVSGTARLRLDLEDGTGQRWDVSLAEVRVAGRQTVRGEEYVALQIAGTSQLPHGYHRLTLELGGKRLESTVISAPVRCWQPEERQWGVFLPLYALHSSRSWGIGDYTDLGRFADWTARRGGSFAGTLPLMPAYLDAPFDPSPYAPVSRLFWNEVYIDPSAPFAGSKPVPDDDPEMPEIAQRLNQAEAVPYQEAMAMKRRSLLNQLRALSPESRSAFDAYKAASPRVLDYARFRAAVSRWGGNWRGWQRPLRDGELRDGDYDPDVAEYFAFAQWRAETQISDVAQAARERDCGLYLDLPVGVHPDSYDCWRFRDQFVEGASVGAPPDVVTTSGQDWGFRPPSSEGLRREGYRYYAEFLQHHMRVASTVRFDHVMGLHRLYWVPAGCSPRDGVYVRYRADEIYAVIALESQRHQCSVIGENLGILEPSMATAMSRHNVDGMYVAEIEMRDDREKPLTATPRRSVASLGTHDLPPFAAFWRGSDIEQRQELGVLEAKQGKTELSQRRKNIKALSAYLRKRGLIKKSEPAEALKGSLAVLAESRARRVIVNLEDLWLEERPQNVPGTTGEQYPSWRQRAKYSLDDLEAGVPAVDQALDILRASRPRKRGLKS